MVVEAQNVAVVFGAFLRVGEGRVGFAYAHEAAGGIGVGSVVVWVVGFGEGVEGPGGGGKGGRLASRHGEQNEMSLAAWGGGK